MQWPICVSHVTHSTKCIQGMFGSPGSQPAEQEGIGENKNKQNEQEEKGALHTPGSGQQTLARTVKVGNLGTLSRKKRQ